MKKTLKRVLVLALAAAMTLSLAACGGKDNTEEATYTYNLYMEASPTNWNPHTWEMSSDSEIMSYIEMGLVDVRIGEDGDTWEWAMEMADEITDITATYADKEKYGIGADETGRVWEVKLNQNAKWADGTVINADTYVYSMQQLLDPAMKNYRANNYITGTAALYGASDYFYSDLAGQDYYASLSSLGFGSEADAVAAGTELYIDIEGFWGITTADGKGWASITDETEIRDEAVEEGQDEDYVSPKYLYETYLAAGQMYESYAADYLGGVAGQYAAASFEDVGFVKVDDYTFLYITQDPVDEFYLYTAMLSNWIVYEDLYEAGKTTTGNLVATNYGTSVDTYMSYGPYKLTGFEVDKQFICEKNDQWYGYTDGKHEGEFQTTTVKYQIVADHNTQLQLFNQGNLDYISLTSDDMATYKMSDNLLKTDQTYTFRWIFGTDLEKLEALEKEANDGKNKKVLYYDDFRKAISLAMNREQLCLEGSAGYKPAYYLVNSLYYYNVAEDPTSVYRTTPEAKKVVLDLYGLEYTEETIDEVYETVTGYDVEAAKALFQSVYEQAIADGNYTEGQEIHIRCCASAASSLTAEDVAQQDLLNDFVAAATVGTGFEGKITFEFYSGSATRYDDVAQGKVEMIRGAWGGAAFYPFQMMLCYCEPEYMGGVEKIHESNGWDPTKEKLTITYDFDGDGTAEDKTDTFQNWSKLINYDNTVDMETKLNVLAAIEKGLMEAYQCIPWGCDVVCSLYSQKVTMGTTEYDIMYSYGGVRHMTYNFTDAEWTEYVASEGGTLNYE